ncbi:hypothetical protein PC9H_000770 [Pleurotus ostreatus]|uniref:Uncharacterized protein n=1 Tax=Pleurotus ostreatus TaxID=5322 RepID=A0A8H7A1N9_PLEOS|nr:uncharacterized protein PC9H_000770 [Pleurotus ostreatus]KAF7440425.1 hypothetical protein PC9H_000770 [Pleurotus ostreatus]
MPDTVLASAPSRPATPFTSPTPRSHSMQPLDDHLLTPRKEISDKRRRTDGNQSPPLSRPTSRADSAHDTFFSQPADFTPLGHIVGIRIKSGGSIPGYPADEWARDCTQMLGLIAEGARATSQRITDPDSDLDTMQHIFNVYDGLRTCAEALSFLVPEETLEYIGPLPPLDKGARARRADTHSSSAETTTGEIKDLIKGLESSLSLRIANIERQVRGQNNPQPRHPPQISTSPNAVAPSQSLHSTASYATATANGAQKTPPAPSATKPSTRPHTNVKFIVRFQGRLPPDTARKTPLLMSTALNYAFGNSITAREANLTILGAEWNRTGNINLVFPANTRPSVVHSHLGIIRPIVDHGVKDVCISHDTKWSKLVCSRVPAHDPEGQPWEPVALGVMLRRNPILKNTQFTQEPRFVTNPIEGLPTQSPIVFAFEDPDGTRARAIMKTPIYMGGVLCPTRLWKEKPKFLQCDRCQGLGHPTRTCTKPFVCAKCAQRHKTTDHHLNCSSILGGGSTSCRCSLRCANCDGEHWATDQSCPEKRKFSTAPKLQPSPDVPPPTASNRPAQPTPMNMDL